jgi:hypothetical protein
MELLPYGIAKAVRRLIPLACWCLPVQTEETRSDKESEMPKVSRVLIALCSAAALLTVGAVGAQASTSGAHFMPDTSASVNDAGALVVVIDEAGVGNENVTYTLTASAQAVYACINGGGNHPKAANKETVVGQVSTGGTFSPTNGRISASLTAGPLSAGGFECPPGQTLALASVSYSDIVLTDTTNGVIDNLDSVSMIFFNV